MSDPPENSIGSDDQDVGVFQWRSA